MPNHGLMWTHMIGQVFQAQRDSSFQVLLFAFAHCLPAVPLTTLNLQWTVAHNYKTCRAVRRIPDEEAKKFQGTQNPFRELMSSEKASPAYLELGAVSLYQVVQMDAPLSFFPHCELCDGCGCSSKVCIV